MIDARVFTERFFAMEVVEGLFDRQDSDGLRYWDVLRHDIYYYLYLVQIGRIPAVANTRRQRSRIMRWLAEVYALLHCRFVALRLRIRRPRYLFVTASRNRIGGDWIDVICDESVRHFGKEAFVLETYTSRSAYLWPRNRHGVAGAVCRMPTDVRAVDPTIADELALIFKRYFVEPVHVNNLRVLVEAGIRAYCQQARYFDLLPSAHAPEVMLVVASGVLKGMFSMAHKHRVGVLEFQHGLISSLHPYYSYPRHVRYEQLPPFFPGRLLIFADFWGEDLHFAGIDKISVGTDHYCKAAANTVGVTREAWLIVTAARYHVALSALTRSLAERLSERKLIYKLHPQQYAHMDGIRREFASYPNVEVCAGEWSMEELFAQAGALITVQSTVVYEALQAGLHVVLMTWDDYQVHENVFRFCSQCANADDVIRALQKTIPTTLQDQTFFDRYDQSRVNEQVRAVSRWIRQA